jgi:hypothetical protein
MWALLPLQKGEGLTDRRRTWGFATFLVLDDPGREFRFPEAEGLEPKFPEKVPRLKGVWINEGFASVLMLALIAVGYAAERPRRTKASPHP